MKWNWILLFILALAACKPAPLSATPPASATEVKPGVQSTALAQLTAATQNPTPTQTLASNQPAVATATSPAVQTLEPTNTIEAPVPFSSTQLANAAALPDPATIQWKKVFSGVNLPVFLSGSGDGSGRLFIETQPGIIYVVRDGALQDQPYLDIHDRVTSPDLGGNYGEQGMLGLAFHPQFKKNGYFYVNYTDQNGNTVIARYTASPAADQVDPKSEVRLLTVEQPYPNHNGGMLAFGPDGYLYIGLGDGGSEGDPQGNGQSVQVLLGKLLRIDVNQGTPYAIPADNPFASGGGRPEIWAYGLRNPWRFSFDALTGDLYIADVGQDQWEEVDFLEAGSPGGTNFGWSYREGAHAYKGQPPENLTLTEPVAEYSHAQGCSITGGVVYRGVNLPALHGVYLYGDYCSGNFWGLLRNPDGTWQNQLLMATGFTISSFGTDEAGDVYLLEYQKGEIYQLTSK